MCFQSPACQAVARDQIGVQCVGEFRARIGRVPLVIKSQAHSLPDKVQRLLRRSAIGQDRLTVQNLVQQIARLIAVDPLRQHLVNTCQLPGILIMQAVIVVVLASPRDQVTQNLLAVLRQREAFQKRAIGLRRARSGTKQQQRNERDPKHT